MIQVTSLGKNFNDEWIFRNVGFTVPAESSAVVLGTSGSGKTLLLKMISGLMAPDEGTVRVGTSNVGMLFQRNALFDSFTVLENLLFPLKERSGLIGKPALEKAHRYLEAVGLKGTDHQYPNELSGGMQKRLGIARALIVDPQVILYDEPTAGLDPITSKLIAELIQTLRRENKSTLLTITNDVNRAYQLGDRIYLLAQGGLIDGGTPTEVRATQDPVIKQFIYGLREGPLTS